MSNFDTLSAILGPKLTQQVMQKLGGRLIRVRKRQRTIAIDFKRHAREMVRMPTFRLAARLECSRDYAKKLKRWYVRKCNGTLHTRRNKASRRRLFSILEYNIK